MNDSPRPQEQAPSAGETVVRPGSSVTSSPAIGAGLPPSCRVALPPDPTPLSVDALFGTGGPIEVDVGCGKGRFLMAKARKNPGVPFLGIDKRLKRIEKVDRKVCREGLRNVRLLLAEAAEVIEERLPPLSVQTFYIFFPDPWPKRRHHRRRLFSGDFIDALHRTLLPEGRVNLATDDEDYYRQIRKLLAGDARFVEAAPYLPTEDETTEFETTFVTLGSRIHRCSFAKLEVVEPT